jgi:hypothetical protein
MPDRSTEPAAINSYINAHGAGRCPERFAARVTAALPPQIEAARIAAIAIKPALTRVENREQLRRLLWGLRAGNPVSEPHRPSVGPWNQSPAICR